MPRWIRHQTCCCSRWRGGPSQIRFPWPCMAVVGDARIRMGARVTIHLFEYFFRPRTWTYTLQTVRAMDGLGCSHYKRDNSQLPSQDSEDGMGYLFHVIWYTYPGTVRLRPLLYGMRSSSDSPFFAGKVRFGFQIPLVLGEEI